jgi:hypothetical protein
MLFLSIKRVSFIAYQITADLASAAISRDSYSAPGRDKRYALYWGTDCQAGLALYVTEKKKMPEIV